MGLNLAQEPYLEHNGQRLTHQAELNFYRQSHDYCLTAADNLEPNTSNSQLFAAFELFDRDRHLSPIAYFNAPGSPYY